MYFTEEARGAGLAGRRLARTWRLRRPPARLSESSVRPVRVLSGRHRARAEQIPPSVSRAQRTWRVPTSCAHASARRSTCRGAAVPAPGAFHPGTLDLGDLPRARAASRQGRTGKRPAGSLKTDHDDMGQPRHDTRRVGQRRGPARSALRVPFLAQPPVRTEEAPGAGRSLLHGI